MSKAWPGWLPASGGVRGIRTLLLNGILEFEYLELDLLDLFQKVYMVPAQIKLKAINLGNKKQDART